MILRFGCFCSKATVHLHVTIVKIPFLADWKIFVFSKWPHSKSWLQLFRVASKAKLFASLKTKKETSLSEFRHQTSDKVSESSFKWNSFMFLMLFGSFLGNSTWVWQTDGQTDGGTDTPSYRDARTPLKPDQKWWQMIKAKARSFLMVETLKGRKKITLTQQK